MIVWYFIYIDIKVVHIYFQLILLFWWILTLLDFLKIINLKLFFLENFTKISHHKELHNLAMCMANINTTILKYNNSHYFHENFGWKLLHFGNPIVFLPSLQFGYSRNFYEYPFIGPFVWFQKPLGLLISLWSYAPSSQRSFFLT
jgi:hypothetical protein